MAQYMGSAYNDTITMAAGTDDFAFGFSGNDVIQDDFGLPSNDSMYGGDGADTLITRGGVDVMYGENGRDTFQFFTGFYNITIDGGNGNDTLKVDRNLFAPGEADALDELADSGALFALANGGVAYIKDIEVIWLS